MRRGKKIKSPYIWTFTTYFAEGFPFTFIRSISSMFFKDMHITNEKIGYTSLYGIPWIIKFLWGPFVDQYSTKRKWLLSTQSMLFVMMVISAFLVPLENSVTLIAMLFAIGAFLAATHDIAIDGYYMEALDDDGQAEFVGYRVMAYRVAMIFGTGFIMSIGTGAFNKQIKWLLNMDGTPSTTLTWGIAFGMSALSFGLILLYHTFFLAEPQKNPGNTKELLTKIVRPGTIAAIAVMCTLIIGMRKLLKSEFYSDLKLKYPFFKTMGFGYWTSFLLLISLLVIVIFHKKIAGKLKQKMNSGSSYFDAFSSFIDREKIGPILIFIIMTRVGEWIITLMKQTFFHDLGIKQHYGWMASSIWLPASIGGAMLGGWLISRYSLKKMLWPFILLQNIPNLFLAWIALHLKDFLAVNAGSADPMAISSANITLIAVITGFEQLTAGLGIAALSTFLLRICKKEFKAAHYAIGSGLMSVSGIFGEIMAGYISVWFGYAWVFAFSFIATIPGMIVIPFLPNLDKKPTPQEQKAG